MRERPQQLGVLSCVLLIGSCGIQALSIACPDRDVAPAELVAGGGFVGSKWDQGANASAILTRANPGSNKAALQCCGQSPWAVAVSGWSTATTVTSLPSV
jgi:hypothetical protein